jgi:hypothetical protein
MNKSQLLFLVMPFADVDQRDPLFNYEVRHIRWGETEQRLRRFSRRAAFLTLLLVGGLWLFSVLSTPINSYSRLGNSMSFIAWMFVISIGANVLLDLATLIAGVAAISAPISSGLWDLLRLTPLRLEQIIQVKAALVEIRAWRMMIVIVALRLAVVGMLLVTVLFVSDWTGTRIDFTLLITLAALVAFGLVYLVEPLWRMPAVAMLSLYVSARVQNLMYAFLLAFALEVALWITQAIVMGILIFVFVTGVMLLLYCSPLVFLGVGWVIYRYYAAVRGWAERRIYDRLSRLN